MATLRWLRVFNLGKEVRGVLVHSCICTCAFPMQAHTSPSEVCQHQFDSPCFHGSRQMKGRTWWRQDVGQKIARAARIKMVRQWCVSRLSVFTSLRSSLSFPFFRRHAATSAELRAWSTRTSTIMAPSWRRGSADGVCSPAASWVTTFFAFHHSVLSSCFTSATLPAFHHSVLSSATRVQHQLPI